MRANRPSNTGLAAGTPAKIFIVGIVLGGCVATASRVHGPHATIDDVAVPATLDSGYKVVAVDGKPVERARSSIDTVVPVAIIQPGTHTLSIEPHFGATLEATTVSAAFEAGKRYRLKFEDEGVTVVEDADRTGTPTPEQYPQPQRDMDRVRN